MGQVTESLRLRLLGTLDVEEVRAGTGPADPHPLLRQPKRTAVLVYLLLEGHGEPVPRERLTEMFWSGSPEARGRGALRQSLRYLRASLPDRSLVRRGNRAIGVDLRRVGCDVLRFRDLLAAGRPADALALYRGDLLEGFLVDAGEPFDRWLADRRRALRSRAAREAWGLAERAAGAARRDEAAFWGRRAFGLSPEDEESTRRLMRVLAGAGDRGGVLQAYARLEERLEREGGRPDPLTRRIADEARELDPGESLTGTDAPGGRRSGVDRRSGEERREGDGDWSGEERRSGDDRRSDDERRSGVDRRQAG